MAKMNPEDALDAVKILLASPGTTKSATAMRDRLIEIAGDRTKLVQLMDAVGGLPRELTEEK
jgi:hypothetical protein